MIQPSFTGGELAPSLYARMDLARYQTSLKTAKNMIVRQYGGIMNRAGTQYIGTTKVAGERVRLIAFQPADAFAYVIELGDRYMRFIYQGAYLLDDAGATLEVATPWTASEIDDVAYTQSNDTMYLVHPSYSPKTLVRTTATSFVLADYANREGPFRDINTNEAVLVATSAASGPVTITATPGSGIFSAQMVGALFYIEQKALGNSKPWTQGEHITLGAVRISNGKTYKATTVPTVLPGGNTASWTEAGSFRPVHDQGREWDGDGSDRQDGTYHWIVGVEWEYQDAGYGIVQITGYTDAQTLTGQVVKQLPETVVGGPGSPAKSWNYTGNGSQTTFSIAGALSSSTSDYGVSVGGTPTPSAPGHTPPVDTCVVEESFMPGGFVAADVEPGTLIELGHELEAPSLGTVKAARSSDAACVRILTASGAALVCSTSAPIPTRTGLVRAPLLMGHEVVVRRDEGLGWEAVASVTAVGLRRVRNIFVDDRCFWAGEAPGVYLLHHNAKP